MKKYLALAAMLFASNAYAMESEAVTTENQTVAQTQVTEEENALNQLTNELITELGAQGCSDKEIFNFVMSIKRFKDLGLTDRQIMQRLEAFTGKGSVRTSRRNSRQIRIVATLAFLVGVGVAAAALYLLWKKSLNSANEANKVLRTQVVNRDAIITALGYDYDDNGMKKLMTDIKRKYDAGSPEVKNGISLLMGSILNNVEDGDWTQFEAADATVLTQFPAVPAPAV